MRILSLALVGMLAVTGFSQSTLAVTGTINPGNTVDISLTGAPADALTLLAVSQDTGSTTLGSGMLSVTLDLDSPVMFVPLGFTDANGDAGVNFTVPASAPMLAPMTLHIQAVTVEFSFGMGNFGLTATTSNATTLDVGI